MAQVFKAKLKGNQLEWVGDALCLAIAAFTDEALLANVNVAIFDDAFGTIVEADKYCYETLCIL